jgi:hypothetical protein
VSNPDALKLVGRKRTDGMPFEMYVRNGKVHVMLNDFGRYVRTNDSMYGQWVQSSEIVVLDVQNPSAISEVTHYDVPGSIADSRLVGDVLYLVTYEDGYCYGCQQTPGTIVTSFNLAGANVAKVDTLAFSSANSYSWKRSVSDFGSLAPNLSRMIRAQRRRAARNFATSSRRSLWALKKKDNRGAK